MANINSALDKGYGALDRVVNFTTDNKERLGKSILNGLLLLIIFAIFGCFDFVNVSFHFEYLLEISYWTKTLSKAVAGVLAYNIGVNLLWDRNIARDNQLKEQAEKYERLNKLKDQKSFNYYVIYIFNTKEKKKAYISQMNKKIYWLNKFTTNKNKLLYDDDNVPQEKKDKKRYCRKRKELEMLKSEEYINKNLSNIKVKYHYVDPIVFDLELDGKGTYKGTVVSASVGVEKGKATINVLLGMLGVSALTTSFIVGANEQQFANQMVAFWNYLLVCCTDAFIVLWNTFRGMVNSRKLISNSLTRPLIGRNKVLMDYTEYCVENKIEMSKATMIYNKIVESEEKVNERMA